MNYFCYRLFANCQIVLYFLMQLVIFYKTNFIHGVSFWNGSALIVDFWYASFKKIFCRYSFSAVKYLSCDFICSCRLFSSVNIQLFLFEKCFFSVRVHSIFRHFKVGCKDIINDIYNAFKFLWVEISLKKWNVFSNFDIFLAEFWNYVDIFLLYQISNIFMF